MKTMKPQPCRMIQTTYKGPTDYRVPRVIARNINTGTRVTVPWNHALDDWENHLAAAQALLKPEPSWRICSYSSTKGGGFVFATELSWFGK